MNMARCMWFSVLSSVLYGCVPQFGAQNEIKKEIISPDGGRKVVFFQREAGATVDFNTQVSILPVAARLPDAPGNVLIVDQGEVSASWVDPTNIIVRIERGARIFEQVKRFEDIRIHYEAK